jgi:hypothetical protein
MERSSFASGRCACGRCDRYGEIVDVRERLFRCLSGATAVWRVNAHQSKI